MAKTKAADETRDAIIDLFNRRGCFRPRVPEEVQKAAYAFLCKRGFIKPIKGKFAFLVNGAYMECNGLPQTRLEKEAIAREVCQALLNFDVKDPWIKLVLRCIFDCGYFWQFGQIVEGPPNPDYYTVIRDGDLKHAQDLLQFFQDVAENLDLHRDEINAAFPKGEQPEANVLFEYALERSKEDIQKAEAKLEKLMDEKKALVDSESAPAEKGIPSDEWSHSPDFCTVIWFGDKYAFSKGQQAFVVSLLWEQWEAGGHGLSKGSIESELIEAGWRNEEAKHFRLNQVFRNRKKPGHHPAWGTMIQDVGKGVYCLAPGKNHPKITR